MFGYPVTCDDEEMGPQAEQEPEPVTERFVCEHRKVYAAKGDAPYPWVCFTCGKRGEDPHYPVCDSVLYWELVRRNDVDGSVPDLRPVPCYYCATPVLGRAPSAEPAKCGKCI